MKKIILILAFITLQIHLSFSQTNDDLTWIENFYQTSKAEKFWAYQQFQTGMELLGTEQYSRARNKFENAIRKDTTFCDALFMLGYTYQKKEEFQKSIDYCNKAIQLKVNNPSAYTIKAYSYLCMNDTLKAFYEFDNTIKYGDKKIDGYYGKALLFFLQKKYFVLCFQKVDE